MEFNPYVWHTHHKPGKPRWRVRQGMAEERLKLIDALAKLNEEFEHRTTFGMVDRWEELHQAILACEEFEEC